VHVRGGKCTEAVSRRAQEGIDIGSSICDNNMNGIVVVCYSPLLVENETVTVSLRGWDFCPDLLMPLSGTNVSRIRSSPCDSHAHVRVGRWLISSLGLVLFIHARLVNGIAQYLERMAVCHSARALDDDAEH